MRGCSHPTVTGATSGKTYLPGRVSAAVRAMDTRCTVLATTGWETASTGQERYRREADCQAQRSTPCVVIAVPLATADSYLGRRCRSKQRAGAVYAKAIAAAEQQFGSGTGPQKLDWVTRYLQGNGVPIDSALLEALVYEVTG